MADVKLPRREFLKAGVAGAAVATATGGAIVATPPEAQAAQAANVAPAAATSGTWMILTPQEADFFAATSDTIIPRDNLSPSGTECGVPIFIDRQLASAWGGGDRMYRSGPYVKGTPEQGYQLPLTPHQFFVAGIQAANAWCEKTYGGKTFDRLSQAQRNEALTAMEKGTAEFDGLNARQFFNALLTITMEGFFSDPIYGGNRNMASWRMLGFPGLPALYADKVEQYRGKRYVAEPKSIADFS
jgi:gluconate 2-dehydrogenase gamma chain